MKHPRLGAIVFGHGARSAGLATNTAVARAPSRPARLANKINFT